MHYNKCHRLLVLLFLITCLATTALGQEFRATVNGRVIDPAGLAIPGVAVTAVNLNTNETASAVTSDQGTYTIPFLKPGLYSITAEMRGFKKYSREKQEL